MSKTLDIRSVEAAYQQALLTAQQRQNNTALKSNKEVKDISIVDLVNQLNNSLFNGTSGMSTFAQSISAIQMLCQAKASVSVQFKQGKRICIMCDNPQSLDQAEKGLALGFNCSQNACLQFIHNSCMQKQIAQQSAQMQKALLEAANLEEYNSILNTKKAFNCPSCKHELVQPPNLQRHVFEQENQLKNVKDNKLQAILAEQEAEKTSVSSCFFCKSSWLQEAYRRRIVETDLSDSSVFMEQKENKTLCRIDCCKQVFCRSCIAEHFIKENISQGKYPLCCPSLACQKELSYKQARDILSQKYNWFMKFRLERFVMKPLLSLGNDIEFHRCPGLYKIDGDSCEEIGIQDKNIVLAAVKQLKANPDITKITNIPLKKCESITQCHRVYIYQRQQNVSLTDFFNQRVLESKEAEEREEMEIIYKQFTDAGTIPFEPNAANQANGGKYLFTCKSNFCSFGFCLNGCIDSHAGQCPKEANPNADTPLSFVQLSTIYKEPGQANLWSTGNTGDEQVLIDGINLACIRCYNQIQPINPEEASRLPRLNKTHFKQCTCKENYPHHG